MAGEDEYALVFDGQGHWGERDFPKRGWVCQGVTDLEEPVRTCEMCQRATIRFVHHMLHPPTGLTLDAGYKCAGKMEEDEVVAEARDRGMRNAAQRRKPRRNVLSENAALLEKTTGTDQNALSVIKGIRERVMAVARWAASEKPVSNALMALKADAEQLAADAKKAEDRVRAHILAEQRKQAFDVRAKWLESSREILEGIDVETTRYAALRDAITTLNGLYGRAGMYVKQARDEFPEQENAICDFQRDVDVARARARRRWPAIRAQHEKAALKKEMREAHGHATAGRYDAFRDTREGGLEFTTSEGDRAWVFVRGGAWRGGCQMWNEETPMWLRRPSADRDEAMRQCIIMLGNRLRKAGRM